MLWLKDLNKLIFRDNFFITKCMLIVSELVTNVYTTGPVLQNGYFLYRQ